MNLLCTFLGSVAHLTWKDRELVSGSGVIGEADRDLLTPLEVSDSPVEKFREFLEIRGEKLTQPRRVLVRHIFNTHKHFDADELFRDLHDAGHQVSRSTVYRPCGCSSIRACCASCG